MSMTQAGFRMPATGEAWREETENGPSLFTIIGMAHDVVSGAPMVVYSKYEPMDALTPICVCPLGDFIALVPCRMDKARMVPRFRFDREAPKDPRNPYISPVFGYRSYSVVRWDEPDEERAA
jgi:hypothetical protein